MRAVNISRSKDTENYPPSGGGLLVESGKALETAVCITVASDDDAFVKEHDNNMHTRLLLHFFFSFFGGGGEFMGQDEVNV